MKNDQTPVSKNGEQDISQRTQQLVNYLENLWQRPQEPTTEVLKRITTLVANLPEPYKIMGISKIAEYLVSSMGLHFLDLMTTLKQKVNEEEISSEEYVQTVQGVLPELFPEIMGISKHVYVRSLEDLITFSNITLSLYNLSRADSADEIQNWIYELPQIYWNQLLQEHLVTTIQVQSIVTATSNTMKSSGYIAWNSSLPKPVDVTTTDIGKNIPALA